MNKVLKCSKVKSILFMLVINVLFLSAFCVPIGAPSMLTGQMGINASLANQVVGMFSAGMDVWAVIGLVATFNAAGIGLLFVTKKLVQNLGRAAVVAW